MMLSSAVYLLVALLSIPYARACMCSKEHPQQDFCDADFVVRASVEALETIHFNGRPGPSQIRYSIDIKHIYKSSDKFKHANQSALFVPGSPWLCKLELATEMDYVITGRVYLKENETEGEMHTTMCDFNEKYSILTKHQRKFLKHTYAKNCECKVRTCHPLNTYCREQLSDQECLYLDDPYAPKMIRAKSDLLTQYSYCQQRNNKCKWKKNRMLMSALRRSRN